jgi:peptidoglycan/LPS O-acetylase OafA/YrhL
VKTIAGATQSRDNNFTALRFLAATAVIWFHSYALTERPGEEPLHRLMSGAFDLGFLGVAAFFAISGFLVTKSFTERRSPWAFMAARALRIYPGLVAATLFTILVAGACSTLPWFAFATHRDTVEYLLHTSSGFSIRHLLPGAFQSNPYPHSANGSLWTLPMELKMYVACLAAGVLGLYRRRWLFNACFFAGVALFAWHPEWFPVNRGMWVARQLGLAFAIGSFAWINRDWIPLNAPLMLAAVLLMLATPRAIGLGALFVPLYAYLVLALALHPRLHSQRWREPGDYSYGLYVYAFPIQQALLANRPGLEPLQVFAAAFPTTLLVAVASWHLVERPALALKSRLGSGRATAATSGANASKA